MDMLPINVTGAGSIKKAESEQKKTASQPAKEDLEGSRSPARSTGMSGLISGMDDVGLSTTEDKKEHFELYGFRVVYTLPGSTDCISSPVRVFFKTFDDIKKVVKGDKYYHTLPNQSVLETTIAEGMPCVAFNERLKYRYDYQKDAWERV